MNQKLSVILVNYNGKEYNNKCITSIFNSTLKENIQIVVVDNASTDDSVLGLKSCWGQNSQVTIIELDQNYGFSKANNEGIKWSLEHGIKRFLLLNNDTEIEMLTIERMIDAQEKTGNIVVPKIYYANEPNRIWCAGGDFSHFIWKSKQRGLNQTDQGQFNQSGVCKFANGCCMLLTEEIINKVGLLDENFFLYYEDTEFSFRAQERGVAIWYCAEAVVYHKVSGSTKGNSNPANAYYITRNWLMCNRIHMKRRFGIFFLYFLCNRLIWTMIWCLQGKFHMISEMLLGVNDFYKRNKGKRIHPKC